MKKRLPEYTGRHKKECLRTVENPQQEGTQDNSNQMRKHNIFWTNQSTPSHQPHSPETINIPGPN